MPSSIISPFPVFNDLDGTPLENGYIYIGQSNLNPETAPVNVFWDAARTIPAPQPIRTIGGFPSRNGSPSNVYVENDTYSITVRNSRRVFVYSAFDQTDAPSSVFDISTQVITATAGQTTFTLTTFTYLPGTDTLQVYRNGLRLTSGTDYLESSTSTVTMTSPAALGDEFLFQGGSVITGNSTPGTSVSFIQAGTGAVTRNMQDKVRESVSVKDFGAVGDGVTDDTEEIQAAVTAAGLFGTVQFPSGTYKITSTITVPAISGNVAAITFTSPGTATIRPAANLAAVFTVTGCQCVFENLNIDVGASSTTVGIKVSVSPLNASLSATVSRCNISGFQKGLELSGQNYNIFENYFQNNTRAIHFIDDGRNSSISRNYVLGGSIGVQFTKATQQCEGSRIIDNTFLCTGANGASVLIEAGLDISIIGNVFDQNGANTVGIYCNPPGSNAISRIKIISNWIVGGLNSYACFFSGNSNTIFLISNTIAECNSQVLAAGISCSNTNTIAITNNNSLISNVGSGADLVTVSCVNVSQFGNSSTRGQANFINNLTVGDFTSSTGLYSSKGVFGGQSITGGGAAPTATEPVGSLYMRSGGSVGSRLYVSQGAGSWIAVAGV